MRFERALLIYNGNAGKKDIKQALGVSVPILSSGISNLLILQTQRINHAKELCELHGPDVDLVIILGGDGTVHECINGLSNLDHRPMIGILPAGTCNDFSRSLMIDQDISKAADQIIHGEYKPVDVLKVDEHYCLNFWGTGLIAETSNNIKQTEKDQLGKISYMLSAIRTMKNMDPFHYVLDIDGERMEGEARLIIAANGNYIGAKKMPFNAISYNDGLADVFIIKHTNMTLLKELFTTDITIQSNELSQEMDHHSGQSITIHTQEKQDVDMDGEVYTKTPSHITVLKHHLQMLKPN
ncbi:YegS/Rv2252/BmrU family lipid kinase [Neobacillus bataviensis]|uniref:YegS/Rv2252/BmrU family lipid kinase n=1 Tax=Neobacillus bataviensis TaxID=220685 RepID=A0A561DES8_9BACI|nr:YegS/Rv2252/BmrU family lipid kinase [Neobacillus bataviensis]TWE01905.1 YegS/Rv2252/BmrU family lipid kinase [Neobacillus bataviensis]